jgi:serine/threonine protein kinase
MGAVYKARQRELDRLVAVKILPPQIARDPAFAERFTREARALARLSHPNIVAVYDFGRTSPLPSPSGRGTSDLPSPSGDRPAVAGFWEREVENWSPGIWGFWRKSWLVTA